MMERDFEALLAAVRAGERPGVREVRADSRQVAPGDIFVAVPGASEDGSRFIPQAVAAGAGIVVCRPEAAQGAGSPSCRFIAHEDPREALWRLAAARWHTEELPLRVVGITGTNGKTTTAALLEHLFTAAGHRVGVLGTVTYRWPGHSEAA